MTETLLFFSSYLEEKKESLINELLEKVDDDLDLNLNRTDRLEHKDLLKNLLSQVSNALLKSREQKENMELEYDKNSYFWKRGSSLKEMVETLSTFRLYLMKKLKAEGVKKNITEKDILLIYEQVVFIFDEALRHTTKEFNDKTKEMIETVENEILELGAPIVPIKNAVAVLPLVGSFHEKRINHILNNVIPKVVGLEVEILVIDLSGVHVFDTFVAHGFFEMRKILSLLGIKTIMTGVRPDLAQTAVQLGLDTQGIQTFNSVKDVLETLDK
ncbi:STAS domain-containing protein (plasmid) [Priestia megaterium]|uniref:STAS domain-containing protein n=1 Tax=Priestia megaterium TaxID=1404 RepID=UPI0035BE2C33